MDTLSFTRSLRCRRWIASGVMLGGLLAAWAPLHADAPSPPPPAAPQEPLMQSVRTFGPLVEPVQLRAMLGRVRVIDIREGGDDGLAPYATGHIAGALAAPYSRWLRPGDDPGALRPVAEFTALVRGLGLTAGVPIVVVSGGDGAGDFGASARVYWTLAWMGFKQLAILNGGMRAWDRAGFRQSSAPVVVRPSSYTPSLDDAIRATRSEVRRDIDRPTELLLDARPHAYFAGAVKSPDASRPGTLPGAREFDNARWFPDGSGRLPDRATLERIARGLPGADAAGRPIVSFCNTGLWASTNWFVLSQVLERPRVALYPGSMVDWSRADMPMENVPTRAQQLWMQMRSLLGAR